jgi:CO/xanthine dehydrogenase Mo-binding subunit
MLEAAPQDLALSNGGVSVRGVPDRFVTLAEIATRAMDLTGPLWGRGAVETLPMPSEAGAGCAGRAMLPAFTEPTFCTHAARVRVDTETGVVTVLEAVSAQEVGCAINPVGVEGQMEGGLVHGIGNALTEHTVFQDGMTLNPGFLDYKLMTASDAPAIKTAIVETPSAVGPFGGRGVGEPPVIAIAGAIGNAIRAGAGVHVTRMPMTPDRVYEALREREGRR